MNEFKVKRETQQTAMIIDCDNTNERELLRCFDGSLYIDDEGYYLSKLKLSRMKILIKLYKG